MGQGGKDKLVWHHDRTGQDSVKFGYKLLQHISDRDQVPSPASSSRVLPSKLWHSIWSLQVPPKIKFFMWR